MPIIDTIPGRQETYLNFTLDTAHNPDAAKTLVQTLNELYPNSSFGFILGFLKDKDSHGFMNEIKDVAEKSWFVDMDMHRGQSASISKKIGDRILKNTETALFSDAIDKSLSLIHI